ncbi:hypothetical protein AAC387_Pa02g3224 [Persea americana]
MGRAPCCDKANVKKGPWSPEEDAKLKAFIEEHGTGGNWIALPQKIGLKRCGKSCRLRWLNYLRPNIKHGGFSEEEDNIICSLYISIGSRWSIIAAQLPGRTDNDIKNYWNTRLKKKLFGKQRKEHQARRICGLNQEVKRESGNSMIPEQDGQNPYFPQPPLAIPVPHPNQDPHLSDHTAIRKLLLKLGGRFSDDHDGANLIQRPLHTSTTQFTYQNSINLASSSSSMNFFPNPYYSTAQDGQYCTDDVCMHHILQGSSGERGELQEMHYRNAQRFEELDCFCGTSVVNEGNGTNSTESTSWGDGGSLPFPPSVSNYDYYQQGMLQESVLGDSKYPTSQ